MRTPHRLVSPRGLLLAAVASVSLSAASAASRGVSADAPTAQVSPWRQAVEQRLDADNAISLQLTTRAPDLSPVLLRPGLDPDLVTLPTYRVYAGHIRAKALTLAIRREHEEAKAEALMTRLGTGMHAVHGRHFGAGVLTVFYVPVFAAVGFSW